MNTIFDVTIGIPVFNVEKYIERSMLSALNQEFDGTIEILIINDGCSDSTIDIINKLSDEHSNGKNIRIVNHQKNCGVGIARNRILEEAKGRYVLFMDSDDYITIDCVQKLYQEAEKYHTDVVYGSVKMLDTEGNEIKTGSDYLSTPYCLMGQEDMLASYAFKNLHENLRNYMWNILFRKSFLEENKLKFKDVRFHEDVLFSADMVPLVHKAVLIPDITYYYIIRNFSLSNLQGRSSIDLNEIKEFINIYTYVKNKNKTLKEKSYYEARCARSMTQMLYIVSGLLKNRKVISPPLSNDVIKEAMTHPAPLSEIIRFKKYKAANLAFYAIGALPSSISVFLITIIAKLKHLI